MHSNRNTVFWAIIACLLWSTAYACIKIGLQYDTPLHFAGIRFIISGLLILPFTERPLVYFKMLKENWKVMMLVTILQTLINYSLFYMGLKIVPGALAAVLVGSQPLVTALVASFMDDEEKLTKHKILIIIFGILGVILISAGRQAFKLGSTLEFVGVIMILGANVAVATSNVIVSLKSKGINPFVLSSASLGTGGMILFLVSIPTEGVHYAMKPAVYWIDLIWLSLMSAIAFSLWFKLLQRPEVKVSELNLWKFIIPAVGAMFSWLLIPDEYPEILTIIGIFIITGSLIMFYFSAKEVKKRI